MLSNNELLLYHYMMYNIAFVRCSSNSESANTQEILFVRKKEQDANMEKALKQYINNQYGENYIVRFTNEDKTSSYKTLAEENKEKQEQQEEMLASHPLVQSILQEHNGSFVKKIKVK